MKKDKYLTVKLGLLLLAMFVAAFYIRIEKRRLQALIKANEKNSFLYLFSTQWLYRKINGENIFACLEENGYKKVAVYGKNHSCECLCSELEKMGIVVSYIIDDNAVGRYGDIPIKTKENMPKDVDAIIITSLGNTASVQKSLEEVYSGAVLALEDIVKWG